MINETKEPGFTEFEAPDINLENLEFNIETDNEIPEFQLNTDNIEQPESFTFEIPETIPEFNANENIFETENTENSLTKIKQNLADEFITITENNNFKIPENEKIFKQAINELETKIETDYKTTKTPLLKKINLKNIFKSK